MTLFNWTRNSGGRFASTFFDRNKQSPQDRMRMMDVYYDNNDLYEKEAVTAFWFEEWLEVMKPLRTPVHRSVEFFASKMCQGLPKVEVLNKNPQTLEAIQKILADSNFNGKKSSYLRKNALYGNTFFKANFDGEKMYISKLDAKTVTDFEEDERGYLKWIRIDVPLDDGRTYTEYWTVEEGEGYVAIWYHRMGASASLESLGDATESYFLYEFGTTYIPIIHSKFVDNDEKWGKNCVDHVMTKVDEVNREFSNLADLMFQANPYWVVTTGVDKDGIALPVPDFEELSEDEQKKLGRSKFKVLRAGGATAQLSIPDFAWGEFLAIVKDSVEEIEKDLPELKYYTLKESELSGVAIRTLLAGAIDRAKEAEDNFVEALKKIIKICLSMGKFYGLFAAMIGEFEDDDFEMSIQFEEIIPSLSKSDKITALGGLKDIAEMSLQTKMTLAGFSAEEIALVDTVSTQE